MRLVLQHILQRASRQELVGSRVSMQQMQGRLFALNKRTNAAEE